MWKYLLVFVAVVACNGLYATLSHAEVDKEARLFPKRSYVTVSVTGSGLTTKDKVFLKPTPADGSCPCAQGAEKYLKLLKSECSEQRLVTERELVDFAIRQTVCLKQAEQDGVCVRTLPAYLFHQSVLPAVAIFTVLFVALCICFDATSGSLPAAVGAAALTHVSFWLDQHLIPSYNLAIIAIVVAVIFAGKRVPIETAGFIFAWSVAGCLFSGYTNRFDTVVSIGTEFLQHCVLGCLLFARFLSAPVLVGRFAQFPHKASAAVAIGAIIVGLQLAGTSKYVICVTGTSLLALAGHLLWPVKGKLLKLRLFPKRRPSASDVEVRVTGQRTRATPKRFDPQEYVKTARSATDALNIAQQAGDTPKSTRKRGPQSPPPALRVISPSGQTQSPSLAQRLSFGFGLSSPAAATAPVPAPKPEMSSPAARTAPSPRVGDVAMEEAKETRGRSTRVSSSPDPKKSTKREPSVTSPASQAKRQKKQK